MGERNQIKLHHRMTTAQSWHSSVSLASPRQKQRATYHILATLFLLLKLARANRGFDVDLKVRIHFFLVLQTVAATLRWGEHSHADKLI